MAYTSRSEIAHSYLPCYLTYRVGQVTTFLLTFLSYAAFHATRKSFSNVKANINDPFCRADTNANSVFGNESYGMFCCTFGGSSSICEESWSALLQNKTGTEGWCALSLNVPLQHGVPVCDGWFGDQATGTKRLAALDTIFMLCYAVALYVAGVVEDRMNLRWALSFGMVLAGTAS